MWTARGACHFPVGLSRASRPRKPRALSRCLRNARSWRMPSAPGLPSIRTRKMGRGGPCFGTYQRQYACKRHSRALVTVMTRTLHMDVTRTRNGDNQRNRHMCHPRSVQWLGASRLIRSPTKPRPAFFRCGMTKSRASRFWLNRLTLPAYSPDRSAQIFQEA